jgi:hypothetical protein
MTRVPRVAQAGNARSETPRAFDAGATRRVLAGLG